MQYYYSTVHAYTGTHKMRLLPGFQTLTLLERGKFRLIYLTQLLVNLPALRISDLPDWLPDRWKATQKIRLAALQSQTPLP